MLLVLGPAPQDAGSARGVTAADPMHQVPPPVGPRASWVGLYRCLVRLATAVLLLTLPHCRAGEQASSGRALYQGKIVIGTETWPGYLPLYVAEDRGYFKQQGVNVEVRKYIALGELSKDYVAGRMQARANLTLDAVHERMQGLDHRVVLAIDHSNGADAIVARRGIESVRDFRGKRVGYEPGTLEEFFVVWALRENGLRLSDVAPVYGDPQETAKMLQEGTIDVAVTHEPFLSKFASATDFHIVYSSADAPGLITDVLTFRTDFIDAHPGTVHAVIVAYFEALSFWKMHPREAYEILARRFDETPERLAEQFKGITMLDERDNYIAFTFALGLDSLYGNIRQIAKFVMKQHERADAPFHSDEMIDRRFIKEMHDGS